MRDLADVVRYLVVADEIWVEHRTRKENTEASEQPPVLTPYAEQFRSIFESGRHADVKFIVGEEEVEIPAHRAILSARAEYFSAMFREGGMLESTNGVVRTHHDPNVFRRMLEFIYTNSVRDLATTPPNDIIALITLANEYLLDDLRVLCERAATRIISLDNITRLMLLSANHTGSGLREACLEFMRSHKQELLDDVSFRQEVEQSPELGLFLFESTFPNKRSITMDGDDSPDCSSSGKRRRIAENSETETDLAPAHLAAAAAAAAAHAHAHAHTGANAGVNTPQLPPGTLSAAVPANAAGAAQVLPVPPHIPPALNPPQPPQPL